MTQHGTFIPYPIHCKASVNNNTLSVATKKAWYIHVSKFSISFPTEGCGCYKRLALRGHVYADAPHNTITLHTLLACLSALSGVRVTMTSKWMEVEGLCYQVDDSIGYVSISVWPVFKARQIERPSNFSASFVNRISGKTKKDVIKHANSGVDKKALSLETT